MAQSRRRLWDSLHGRLGPERGNMRYRSRCSGPDLPDPWYKWLRADTDGDGDKPDESVLSRPAHGLRLWLRHLHGDDRKCTEPRVHYRIQDDLLWRVKHDADARLCGEPV